MTNLDPIVTKPNVFQVYSKAVATFLCNLAAAVLVVVTTGADLSDPLTWLVIFVAVVGPTVGVAAAPANKTSIKE